MKSKIVAFEEKLGDDVWDTKKVPVLSMLQKLTDDKLYDSKKLGEISHDKTTIEYFSSMCTDANGSVWCYWWWKEGHQADQYPDQVKGVAKKTRPPHLAHFSISRECNHMCKPTLKLLTQIMMHLRKSGGIKAYVVSVGVSGHNKKDCFKLPKNKDKRPED